MRVGLLTAVATAIAIGAIAITGGGGGGGGSFPTTGNLFVDTTTGNNTCTRSSSLIAYDTTKACNTLDAAYHAAGNGGDIVLVEAGSYTTQTLTPDAGKTSTNDTVFEPDGTASVSMSAVKVGDYSGTIPATGPDHFTIRGFTMTGSGISMVTTSGGDEVDDVTIDQITGGGLTFAGASNITVENSTFGPCSPDGFNSYPDCTAHPLEGDVTNILIKNNTFAHFRCSNCATFHFECVFGQPNADFWAPDIGVTFDGNKFYDCSIFDLTFEMLDSASPSQLIQGMVIQNNWFDPPLDGSGSPTGNAVFCQGNPGVHATTNTIARFNTFNQGTNLGNNCANWTVVGNLFDASPDCTAGTYSYNVYTSGHSSCGGTGETVLGTSTFPFVNNGRLTASGNWHLTGATTAIDDKVPTSSTCPATDIDGTARPIGTNCDAGSDER